MPEYDEARVAAVARHFAPLTESYGSGEYYTRRREAVLGAIRAEVANARHGLDLGCGNGRYLSRFSEISSHGAFYGADLSAEMLAGARARTDQGRRLVCANASALPFRAGAFDLIFAGHVLPFVADLRSAVGEIVQCLMPGGVFAATAGSGRMSPSIHTLVPQTKWTRLWFAPALFLALQDAGTASESLHREAFQRAGLQVEVRRASFTIGWTGVEEWVRLRWLPFATEEERADAALIFSEIPPPVRAGSVALEEILLVGHKS